MKAKIYGHDIEGTPDEIAKFKQLLDEQVAKLTKPSYLQYQYPYYPPVYIGSPTTTPYKWNEVTCKSDLKMILI